MQGIRRPEVGVHLPRGYSLHLHLPCLPTPAEGAEGDALKPLKASGSAGRLSVSRSARVWKVSTEGLED
eukprot:659685-Pyramimonas_sp.AAC.1